MQMSKILGAVVWVSAVLAGCSGRDDAPPGDGSGCTGVCDGGSDGGADAGRADCPVPDSNGRGPIGQLKATAQRGDKVSLPHLVITAVDYTSRGDAGDYIAYFWAVDPCFPQEGLYVDKFYTDTPGPYLPQIGDEITLEGIYRQYYPNASDANQTRHAHRPVIKSDFRLDVPGVTGKVNIIKTGTVTGVQDLTVPAGFGNADGGSAQANPQYAGARVHIPGPLSLTDPNPLALKRRVNNPQDTAFNGFEVTGGVLVNDYKTYGQTADGGAPRCDWRAVALDGGGVSFPNGIRGVWDTYSNVYQDAGVIPGTTAEYTYILYPQDCATDLPGVTTP
ncbi:conserved uncharacterized protein [Stigmatella aurantiaca DW4/3-1]|uniref:Conserved uncharacterized protein n=2 Tax=Stigmatella aurantiaca TaxID=41 RepID=Q08X44_STIAD|nr:conserved uncharacterized protein [Stigmatella aurantiaca DW4/3-1]EAU65081.1 hypothetical protein STIAU_4687 [Stigmatella aurantiaca DW4/3-1]